MNTKMELKFRVKDFMFFAVLFTLSVCQGFIGHSRRRQHFSTSRGNRHFLKNRMASKYILDVKMPGARPRKAEEYLCTSSKRLPRRTSYIIEYEPHAKATTAHHILLYGCKYPGSRKRIWKCDSGECIGTQKIIYAWAKNAKAVKMPKGVGFAIGGNSGIDYVVMQIHYAKAMKANEKDYSGIKLHLTNRRTKHLAEIYSFASDNVKIPPKSIGFHADIACRFKKPYDIIPFAFRTHAHSTARVISGYRVRKGHWKLIGIGNPQLPQVFYPIPAANRTRIHHGDVMAARCTFDTPHRNRWTYIGSTSKDEMCNFYLMYYKLYKNGMIHHRASSSNEYENECVDIQDKALKKSLKFPPGSDELPDTLKTNHTHNHMHMHAGRRDEEDDDHDSDEDGSELDQDLFDPDEGSDSDLGGDDGALNSEDDLVPDDGDKDSSVVDNEDQMPEPGKVDATVAGDKDKPLQHEDSAKPGVPQASINDKKHESKSKHSKDEMKKSHHDQKSNHDQKSHHDQKSQHHKNTNTIEEAIDNLLGLENKDQKKSVAEDLNTKSSVRPSVDGDWPYKRQGLANIGQVSGLALSKKHLVVFHRADRVWNGDVFDDDEQLTRKYRVKIAKPTVLHLDPVSGAVVEKWGQHRFYLPHGLTIDSKDNIWITDVGAHQVMKFSSKDKTRPILTLGIALTPGDDDDHFCKPADVAVESSGIFYVADGYCNNRIMKFSANGDLIHKWGHKNRGLKAKPGEFNIPHSLALDEKNGILYVADRENGRIQSFDTRGRFKSQIHHAEFGGRLFAVSFTPAKGGLLYAISGQSHKRNSPKPSGFTINPKDGKIINEWSPFSKGFSRPHDVQVTPDNSAVYVSEIGPNRVWKFGFVTAPHHSNNNHVNTNKKKENKEIEPTKKSTHSSSLPAEVDDEDQLNEPSPYTLKKPESNDTPIVPAIVVVAVLATPIALICAAAIIQHLRFKHKRNKAVKKRNSATLMPKSRSGCFSCCKTKKYYYDNKRGFDKLIGEDDSEESSDDYFVRKGAI